MILFPAADARVPMEPAERTPTPVESSPDLKIALRQSLFWAVMFGAGEASFALFASHLDAPTYFFGLLAGIPSLLGPLAQVASASLLDRGYRRIALVVVPIGIQALCFLPLAAIATFSPQPGEGLSAALAVFLVAITLYYILAHLSIPTWSSLISDLVPPDQRGDVFARLARAPTLVAVIIQISVGVALYLAQRKEAAAVVFAVCFAAAFAARLVSMLLVRRMSDPPYQARKEDVFTFWQFIRRARESNFVKFVLFSALLHFGANIAGPYFLPFWIEELRYEMWEWVVLATTGTAASIATMLFWGRFADRFGNKRTIQYCAFLVVVIPIGWLLTANFWVLLIVNMLGAVFWAGFNLCSFNYILEAASAPKRARCVAYYNILVGLGVFLGSLAGAQALALMRSLWSYGLRDGFFWLLIFSALGRVGACLLFLPTFRELREVPAFSLRNFVVQVMHVRATNGLRFMLFGAEEKKDDAQRDGGPDKAP